MHWKLFPMRSLESSEQQQDQQDDDDKAEAAAAIISGAIERPAADAAKAAEQRDNKNNKNDCSNGHAAISSSRQSASVCGAASGNEKQMEDRKVPLFPNVRSRFFFGDDALLHALM